MTAKVPIMWMKTLRLRKKNRCLMGNNPKRRNTPTEDFVTCSEVEDMIAAEMEKSTSQSNAYVLTGRLRERMIESLQVRYDAGKKAENFLCDIVGEIVIDIEQRERLTSY